MNNIYELKRYLLKKIWSLIWRSFVILGLIIFNFGCVYELTLPTKYIWMNNDLYFNKSNTIVKDTSKEVEHKLYNCVLKVKNGSNYNYIKTNYLIMTFSNNNDIYYTYSDINNASDDLKEKYHSMYKILQENPNILPPYKVNSKQFSYIRLDDYISLNSYDNSKLTIILMLIVFFIFLIYMIYNTAKIIPLNYTDYESFVDLINNDFYSIKNIKFILNEDQYGYFRSLDVSFIYNGAKYCFTSYDIKAYKYLNDLIVSKDID